MPNQPSEAIYPCLAVIDGVAIRLDERVAADWMPDLKSRNLTLLNCISPDPSNALDSGRPKRSGAGYPLTYPSFTLTALGLITFGDRTFNSDAELAAYISGCSGKRALMEQDHSLSGECFAGRECEYGTA